MPRSLILWVLLIAVGFLIVDRPAIAACCG